MPLPPDRPDVGIAHAARIVLVGIGVVGLGVVGRISRGAGLEGNEHVSRGFLVGFGGRDVGHVGLEGRAGGRLLGRKRIHLGCFQVPQHPLRVADDGFVLGLVSFRSVDGHRHGFEHGKLGRVVDRGAQFLHRNVVDRRRAAPCAELEHAIILQCQLADLREFRYVC